MMTVIVSVDNNDKLMQVKEERGAIFSSDVANTIRIRTVSISKLMGKLYFDLMYSTADVKFLWEF